MCRNQTTLPRENGMESMFCLVLSLEKAVIRTIMQFARYMPDITLSSAIPRVNLDFD